MLEDFIFAVAALFAVFNPLSISVYFLSLSEGMGEEERKRMAAKASLIALLIAVSASVAGLPFLEFIGIRLGSFKIAGGIVLLILGVRSGMGIGNGKERNSGDIASVPLASPLMSGPGAISMSMLLAHEVGTHTTIAAIVAVVLLSLAAMLGSLETRRAVGSGGMLVMLRVMGLVLVAVAVQFIVRGLREG